MEMLWETPIKNTSLNALRHPAIHPFSISNKPSLGHGVLMLVSRCLQGLLDSSTELGIAALD